MRGVVFPYSRAGARPRMILGLGRADRRGDRRHPGDRRRRRTSSFNIFATGTRWPAGSRPQYQGAGTDSRSSSLVYLAVILLVFSLVVNVVAQMIVRRGRLPAGARMSVQAEPATRSGAERLRRRRIVNASIEVLATLAALLAVAVLVIVVVSVLQEGHRRDQPRLLHEADVQPASASAGSQSGIANAIVGSARHRLPRRPDGAARRHPGGDLPQRVRAAASAAPLQLALDVLNGIPAIVIGIFVFVLLVARAAGRARSRRAFALAILMLPLVARSTQEVLALVPTSLREGSLALGAARWRTTLSVVLPQAVGGIITGATLATARVAGETAPLLFTSSLVGNDVNSSPTSRSASMPVCSSSSRVRAGRPEAPRAGLGDRARPDRLRPRRQHLAALHRARSRRRRTGRR